MNTAAVPARDEAGVSGRVSVALCTYNGAAYIEAQLASILAQRRPVDEIVVSDDGSSDDTLERVQRRLQGSGVAFRVLHGERLGVTQNFARAVSACTGEFVFLCDQDDVWLPEKVERLLALLQSHPDSDLAFSNAELVDAQLAPLGRTQFDTVRLSPALRRALAGPLAFEALMRRNVVTGATVAFRRRLLQLALPFMDGWLHDEWLAVLAAWRGPLACCEQPLVQYRQHGRNQCGMSPQTVSEQVKAAAAATRVAVGVKRMAALRERVTAHGLAPARPDRTRLLDAALAFQRQRQALPAARWQRWPAVGWLAAGGGYGRYDAGWRAAAKDLLGRG